MQLHSQLHATHQLLSTCSAACSSPPCTVLETRPSLAYSLHCWKVVAGSYHGGPPEGGKGARSRQQHRGGPVVSRRNVRHWDRVLQAV